MTTTAAATTHRKARHCDYLGRRVCVSGACNDCLVWIDDELKLGMRRFRSIKSAMVKAKDYIKRHAA